MVAHAPLEHVCSRRSAGPLCVTDSMKRRIVLVLADDASTLALLAWLLALPVRMRAFLLSLLAVMNRGLDGI